VWNAHNTICAKAIYFLHSTRPSVMWLKSRWWLAACNWVMSALSAVLSTHVGRHRKFGEMSCALLARWMSLNWFQWNLADRKSVKSCFAYLKKNKTKISPGYPVVATAQIAPKICQGQPPTIYSKCSRFHPNRFIFGGFIDKCINSAKMRHKVNPKFRIMTCNCCSEKTDN